MKSKPKKNSKAKKKGKPKTANNKSDQISLEKLNKRLDELEFDYKFMVAYLDNGYQELSTAFEQVLQGGSGSGFSEQGNTGDGSNSTANNQDLLTSTGPDPAPVPLS